MNTGFVNSSVQSRKITNGETVEPSNPYNNSYEKRRLAQRDQISTKQVEKDIKHEIGSRVIEANRQRELNKERRELNRVKAGHYQIIKDSTRIRKYDKKARHKVIKMSPEMIDSLMARKSKTLGI